MLNGKSITDEEDIVKELSLSFIPGPKPTGPMQEDVYKTIEDYEKTFVNDPPPQITKEELVAEVKTLNLNASPGNDGMSITLILESYVEIAEVSLRLYNKCLEIK
jgi:hypothetical protein